MKTTTSVPAVQKEITVAVPVDRAFRVFTESFATWWPADYHIGRADYAEAVIEPRAGGRWYERGVDGSECDWGRVLAWEPPHRLVLAWGISGEWQAEPDLANASEVEVRFTADGPESTRVALEHRHLERHGATAQQLHRGVSGDGGWGTILARFADAVAG